VNGYWIAGEGEGSQGGFLGAQMVYFAGKHKEKIKYRVRGRV